MQTISLFESYELNKPKRLIKASDLRPIGSLKEIFRDVRDYFAGNVTGITRDEKIAQNIMRLLLCKVNDEKGKRGEELTEFSNRPNESIDTFYERINNLFQKVKIEYSGILDKEEKIEVSPKELSVIVSKFEDYSILQADRDVIGDAFEELIGTSFRGGEGQFFTPRNVVQMMIDVLQPKAGERVLDPACGSGGFLVYTLRYLMNRGENDFYIAGIDKDEFLARVAKIYLSIIGRNDYHVFCENSLELPRKWKKEVQEAIELGSFDLILTNPPFGAKIPVIGGELLRQYQLGHKWSFNEKDWRVSNKLLDKQPPQILFIERCIQLLKEGGRLGIVLPEGIFGNPSDRYIWEYISNSASIIGVVSLSQETFQPSTHTKTSVLFLKKTTSRSKSIFMAIANKVGHNKNGKLIYKSNKDGKPIYDGKGQPLIDDDLPIITEKFKTLLRGKFTQEDHLGFSIDYKDLKDDILIPEYYDPEITRDLEELRKSGNYDLVTIGELVRNKVLQIRRGNEIGSQFYGSGEIPFVRTTDIVNWEIKVDPVKSVSEEVYNKYKRLQDIREEDILFVSDGTFLIGRSAVVTNLDLKIVIQSHLKKIRVLDKEKIDTYYLFYLLNSKMVRRQIDAKTFVQATISTIGNRLYEIVLPISKDEESKKKIIKEVRNIVKQKTESRKKSIELIEASI